MRINSIIYVILILAFFLYDAIIPYFYKGSTDEDILVLFGVARQYKWFLRDTVYAIGFILFPTIPFIKNDRLRLGTTIILVVYAIKEGADLLLTNNEYNLFANTIQMALFIVTFFYFVYHLIREKNGGRNL